MSRREHNIQRKRDLWALYDAELEAELRCALRTHTEREAQEVIDRESRENENYNIRQSLNDRECFTPDHPNYNTIHTNNTYED